jgi:hypothetical protein
MPLFRSFSTIRIRGAAGVALVIAAFLLAQLEPATAEVRFGRNVRVGGNDVSGQTFNRDRRGLFILHDRQPANEGCHWRANRDGSRTKVCNLKRR